MVTPRPGISQMAPRNEIGIPRLTQNARRKRRKRASEANTSTKPAAKLRSSRLSRPARIFDISFQVASSMPAGIRGPASAT